MPSYSIIKTKLYRPSVSADLILRYNLIDELESNKHRPLTVVSAPAGYGKSVTLSQWLESSSSKSIWISLDAEHNDFYVFLEYLYYGLNDKFKGKFEEFERILQVKELPSLQQLCNIIINEFDKLEDDIILVLDDYHLIKNEQIHELLNIYLEYPSQNVHLVIATRYDPPIKLNKLRAYGRMTEIRMRDLAFSEQETLGLFEILYNNPLSERTLKVLCEKTEGWVVGLRLAMLTLHNEEQADKILASFKNNFNEVATFVIEEVLSQQPEEIQSLLVRSSILNRFCANLIDEILTVEVDTNKKYNGSQFIDWLNNSNLFIISLDNEGVWFRYHHFFQELLQRILAKNFPEKEIHKMHLGASKWFEKNNFIEEAVRHSLVANNVLNAAEIIEKVRDRELEEDRWFLLERWIKLLPAEIVYQRSTLLLSKAWIFYQQSLIAEIRPILDRVNEISKQIPLDATQLAEVDFFVGTFTYFEGKGEESIKYLESARKEFLLQRGVPLSEIEFMLGLAFQLNNNLKEGIALFENAISSAGLKELMYLTRVTSGLVYIHMLSANLRGVEEALNKMYKVAVQSKSLYAITWSEYFKGWLSYFNNKPEQAIEEFKVSIDKGVISNMGVSVNAYVGLILSYQALSMFDKAQRTADQLLFFVQEINDPVCASFATACKARIDLLQGNKKEALNWAYNHEVSLDPLSMFVWINSTDISKARILIEDETSDALKEAISILNQLLENVRNFRYVNYEIEVLVCLSIALQKQGNNKEALHTIESAIELAEPLNWLQPFYMERKAINPLLEQLLADNKREAFIKHLTNTNEQINQAQTITENLAEPGQKSVFNDSLLEKEHDLTKRELETVELIIRGYRNKEIARSMLISENTVKKHVYNIFQKFDVSNRFALIRKACDWGMNAKT